MRQEFSQTVRVAIIKRATKAGVPTCEKCGLPARKGEVDHRIPEGLRVGERKKLTAEDGWLLCAGKGGCHTLKTVKDKGVIAKAKRIEAKHIGAEPPKPPIPQRPKVEAPKREQMPPLPRRPLYR